MADGRSGLTPGAEVNTIPPVSNQGSRFRPITKAIALMERRAAEQGARHQADLNRTIWKKAA